MAIEGRGATLADLHAGAGQSASDATTVRSEPAYLPEGTPAPLSVEEPGRYSIVRELARGGQSIVSLAYDTHVGRQIAFKQLLPSRRGAETADSLSPSEARFVREARIAAQLDHPGIAPIHEVGRRADGSLYATQKLVRGQTLAAALEGCKTLRERLALLQPLLSVCQAVAYAHERAVIHRDLKPANVMLGELGETVVLDWGLARTGSEPPSEEEGRLLSIDSLLDADAARTREGAVIGTPAYMSPEQAVGATAKIDARSDVWSLGVILYELLAGRRPFEGATTQAMLMAIATAPLARVRSVCPEAPAELAAVAERAMARDPTQRYTSAKELAAELSAWLSGGRVVAHEYTSLELIRKFVARNHVPVAAAAIALGVVVGAAIGWQRKYVEARRSLADALVEKAQAAEVKQRWADAAAYYAASRVQDDRPESRLGSATFARLAPRPIARLPIGQIGRLFGTIGFLPDGRPAVAHVYPRGVSLVEVDTGREIGRIDREHLSSASFLGDGSLLETVAEDPDGSVLQLWDLPSGKLRAGRVPLGPWKTWRVSADGRLIALSPTRDLYATAAVSVRELKTGKEMLALPRVGRPLALADDGSILAGTDENGDIALWEVPSGRLRSTLHGIEVAGGALAFTPDSSALLIGIRDGGLRRVRIGESRASGFFGRHDGPVLGFAFARDRKMVATTAARDDIVRVWGAEDQQLASVDVASYMHWAALSPDGRRLLTSTDDSVMLWELAQPSVRPELAATFGARMAAVSGDRRRLAVHLRGLVPLSGTLRVIDLASGAEIASLPASAGYSWRQGVALTTDGARAAVATVKATEVYDLLRSPPALLRSVGIDLPPVALSPDGNSLLANDHPFQAKVWDVATGAVRFEVARPDELAGAAAFSADGKRLVVSLLAAGASLVAVLDAQSGQRLRELRGGSVLMMALALSHDGTRVAGGAVDGVRVWDVESGAEQLRLEVHEGDVWTLAFSPDGRFLSVAAGKNGILWDARTGRRLLRVPGSQTLHWTDFTADSKSVAFMSTDLQWFATEPPADLPPPEQALREVLARFGLRLDGTQLSQADQPAK